MLNFGMLECQNVVSGESPSQTAALNPLPLAETLDLGATYTTPRTGP
jgi:hypothetical protein